MARIDVDPDATVWDLELGWLVDVTMVGGGLDGDGPVLCRLPGRGQYSPPHQGALVFVAIPGGDPNNDCVIVAEIDAVGDEPPPTEINGVTIDEAMALVTHIVAVPQEDLEALYRDARLAAGGTLRLVAPNVRLADPEAGQAFARGNDLATALEQLATAIDTFANLLATAPPAPPNAALTVAAVTTAYSAPAVGLKFAIERFKLAKNTWLSTKIKGE